MVKYFDLNIEKILESWKVYHAVREIIANAIDEQILTDTDEITIYKENDSWHIRDYGRGLNYHHFTQNENMEKLQSEKMIGKFGVGLKDALATFYRHDVNVTIKSKYGIITLCETQKNDFSDITTLHAQIQEDPSLTEFIGTEFVLENCPDEQVAFAKEMFLRFYPSEILETTPYGQVIKREGNKPSFIYINGVRVAREEKFLFSYNITALNTKIRNALNRERTNVGRSAYTDRIKSILLACNEEQVIKALADDVSGFAGGTKHDELAWKEVELYAIRKHSEQNKEVVFVTPEEVIEKPSLVDDIKTSGHKPVVVSEKARETIKEENRKNEGNKNIEPIKTSVEFYVERNEQRNTQYVDEDTLSEEEKAIWAYKDVIFNMLQSTSKSRVKEMKIAEEVYEGDQCVIGLWAPSTGTIVIRRDQLKSLDDFAGVFVHECVHALTGFGDVDRRFESVLSNLIGRITAQLLKYDKEASIKVV